MPGKARRVASRQAQLNRKKRQQRGPYGIPAVEDTTATQDQAAAEDSANQTNGAGRSDRVVATAVAPTGATTGENRGPRPMGAGRLRREQVSSANYVGSELRRILAMGSLMLAVIIILGIAV